MSQTIQSLPRPVLIVIVGAAAAVALMFATRKGNETTTSPAPAQQQSTTSTQAGSGNQTTKPPAAKPVPASARTLPAPVARAVQAHKVVVILFWNPAGSDDHAVRRALAGVSTRHGRVAKFADTMNHLARYTRITGMQAVTQTPTIVVVGRNGKGQATSGFQDTATVDQLVVDAIS
jgi:hypothetical protein